MARSEGGSWRQPWAIARNTFRAAIRNRVLYAILVGAVALVFSSMAIGELSLDNDARVVRDIGTAFLSLTVVAVAIFSGVSLLQVEIARKTIYTIVTKPLSRWMFIVGKFLGLVLTLLVVEVLIFAVLLSIVLLREDPVGTVLVQSALLIFGEGVVVAAVATLFSSFSTPVTSGAITFGVFVLGRLRDSLYHYAEMSESPIFQKVMPVVGVVIPDLSLNRADLEVAHLIPLTWDYVGFTLLYDLLYSSIALAVACFIFARRDFV